MIIRQVVVHGHAIDPFLLITGQRFDYRQSIQEYYCFPADVLKEIIVYYLPRDGVTLVE